MQSVSLLRKVGRLIFLIILVNVIGYVGASYMTPNTMLWYDSLPKANLNPPQYVFPIVWGILFLLQAIAAFLVWGKASPRWFVIQLVLNMLWSFSFFYLKNPALALGVLVLFIIALCFNIRAFDKANRFAGWLIVPTLLWAIFALYLNGAIVF